MKCSRVLLSWSFFPYLPNFYIISKQKYTFINYYRPQTKLQEGNVFTPVCHSFCSKGGLSQHAIYRGCTSPGRHPHRQTPPKTAAEAGGIHPTGMHSSSEQFHLSFRKTGRLDCISSFRQTSKEPKTWGVWNSN